MIVGPMLILLAAISAWVLLRTSNEDRALLARIEAVTAVGRAKASLAIPSITRKDAKPRADWKDTLTGFMGFSLSKTSHYRLGWPWVIVIALVAGRIAVLLGSGMLGGLAWILMPVVTIAISRSLFSMMSQGRVVSAAGAVPGRAGVDRARGAGGDPGQRGVAGRQPREPAADVHRVLTGWPTRSRSGCRWRRRCGRWRTATTCRSTGSLPPHWGCRRRPAGG